MAQLTITVPDAELPRVREAFGPFNSTYADPVLASAEEVRQAILQFLKEKTRRYEDAKAAWLAAQEVTDITPT